MPSFDISSEVNWQELDNAINQAKKELLQRYDFKGIKTDITLDKKDHTITILCSDEDKLEALNDVLQTKLVKRNISLLALEYKDAEPAFGGSVRQIVTVQAGISKEKGKEIIAAIKESKLKLQAQMQDEQVRISGKNKDDLQSAMSMLKSNQDKLKVPLQFGNYRD